MKLAQIQMHVTADKAANLRHAEDLLRSVRGADMAILPDPPGREAGGGACHPAGDVLLPLRQRLLPRLRRA